MLTAELKRQGFIKTRTIFGTTWCLSEAEGFWHPIRNGQVIGSERINRSDINQNVWLYVRNERIEDDDTSFRGLARSHR